MTIDNCKPKKSKPNWAYIRCYSQNTYINTYVYRESTLHISHREMQKGYILVTLTISEHIVCCT